VDSSKIILSPASSDVLDVSILDEFKIILVVCPVSDSILIPSVDRIDVTFNSADSNN